MFRPDSAPLTPNWKHLPIGYHGRAGTVVVSGTPVVRPSGQRKAPDDDAPDVRPVAAAGHRGRGRLRRRHAVGAGHTGAAEPTSTEHVFGVCLVNDWSARDLQSWEYVPLGPFLGKSFLTSVSPWVVPLAALRGRPGRPAGPGRRAAALPRRRRRRAVGPGHHAGGPAQRRADQLPAVRARCTGPPAQQLAHMTVNGASLRTGDLFASGTVSGPAKDQRGSFIELSWGGTEPLDARRRQHAHLPRRTATS